MVLDKIQGPNDVKELKEQELPVLADEIRQFIIDKVSDNGGHLASNLGVVELTIALHRCLNFPQDKLIWDVGHQSYTHKILTGRKKGFDSLRKYHGMSGFPKRDESNCDAFDTGHSSTSLSAGLGMVCARELKKDKYTVVSVIGDGSLTGGLAFEALNNAASLKSNYIMILNDNHMSISENVGGLSHYLAGVRTAKGYTNFKKNVKASLSKMNAIGEELERNIRRAKSMLKQVFIPGMFFEDMGITYLGPIDGHNIEALTEVIEDAKQVEGAVLIHVITEKGKGYELAQLHPESYHGVGPFIKKNGMAKKPKEEATYTDIFAKTICELAQTHEKLVTITAAMKDGCGLKGFAKRFPDRFFDVGIAEEHAVTFACGLAAGGFHPFFVVYSSFLQRGYDQILHDMCMQNLPVTLMLDRAGLVGNDGETHQGVFDLSYLTMIPNMTVFAPKNRYEFQDAIAFAADFEAPMAIRYPKTDAVRILKEYREPIKLGKSEWIRIGSRVALLAIGTMVETAMEVEELLAKDGIDATVVNLRFAKPLDYEMLDEVLDYHSLIVTMEENVLSGGVGEHICRYVELHSTGVRVVACGIPDKFIHQGSIKELLEETGLDAQSIYQKISTML
ncbi:MAG: 1-deoxy-D-xylulose-5-phosphate synthase [Clostridiales bacterium]|nr:1-deoxy-D-xylulose-5-phosphate synthase [Clostridiales bacterium]